MTNTNQPQQETSQLQVLSEKLGLSVSIEKTRDLKPGETRNILAMIGIKEIDNKEAFVFNENIIHLIKIKDINKNYKMGLIEITKMPNSCVNKFYSSNKLSLLIGKDEQNLFITRMEEPIKTVDEALRLMEPVSVRGARKKGVNVKRQGDWFFIPVKKVDNTSRIFKKLHLTGDHICDEGIILRQEGWKRCYVRGSISHPQHSTLYLSNWHRAIQNQTKFYKRVTKMLVKEIQITNHTGHIHIE